MLGQQHHRQDAEDSICRDRGEAPDAVVQCARCCHEAIDHEGLTKAMDLALVTPKQLAEATGMSLTYVCDITAGRRTLKRNPELRKKIAVALNVPQHWIEHAEPVAS